jgi:hypothetical protein
MARTIEQLEELKHGERAEPSQHKAQSITKHPKSTPSDAISCGMRQALFHLVSHLCRTCTCNVTHVPHVPLLLPLKREASTPKNILQSKAGFKSMNTEI